MDVKIALSLALPIGLGLAALGTGMGLGRAVGSALEAIGRQPEVFNKILIALTIGCAFIESIMIYVLLFTFMHSGKIG